jgi:O-antigen/teichoic acid export membrane protein
MADKLTSMAAALFVSIPIARHLGPEDYGLLALSTHPAEALNER